MAMTSRALYNPLRMSQATLAKPRRAEPRQAELADF